MKCVLLNVKPTRLACLFCLNFSGYVNVKNGEAVDGAVLFKDLYVKLSAPVAIRMLVDD